jgi:serine O-acetyltransferase
MSNEVTQSPEAAAKKPGFLETLRTDIPEKSFLAFVFFILARPGCFAVFLFRASSSLHKKGKIGWVLSMICWRLNIIFNGCEIQPVATIGPGFSIVHPVGIVIGNATIGRNFSVYQNVTIGRTQQEHTSAGKEIQPTFGDNVVIYSGAAVLGAVKIGSGAKIGANAVVMKDVPENCTMISMPARAVPPKRNNEEVDGKANEVAGE